MNTVLIVILSVLGGFLFVCVGIAFAIAVYAVKPPRRSEAALSKEELGLKQVDPELYKIPYEEITIKSDFGYDIFARGYFCDPKSHKYAVLVHGHNAASSGMVRFMELFRRRGINTLLPDNRYSAKTGGRSISFGYYEKFDVIKCIEYLFARDPQAQIGIMGESMGGATAIMVAAKRPDLKFCIDYCGYASMKLVLRDTIRRFAPAAVILYPLIKAFVRIIGGFFVGNVSPMDDAKKISIPVLLLHSRADAFVLFRHHEMIAANLKNCERVIFEKSQHGLSLNTYPEQFAEGINAFLDKMGF